MSQSPQPSQPESFDALRAQFHDPDQNYEILRGEKQAIRGVRGAWDTDYMLERYTSATDHVIGLLDGSIQERHITDPANPEKAQKAPDTVIWLDKSARPVSWLVDGLWEQFADKDAQKPNYEFLNIDRTNWFVQQGHIKEVAERHLGPEDFDINKVSQERIDRLRALFVEGELHEETWREEVWKLPTRLDGQHVMIIDEVMNKGGTLAVATQVIKRAIPDSVVTGDYFWPKSNYAVKGYGGPADDFQMDSAPVWYDKDNRFGRGVGEISFDYWRDLYNREPTQENFKKKLGSLALSAPHFKRKGNDYELLPDPAAIKLQQDIAYLSHAVAEKRVPRTPSLKRSEDQMVDIIERQGMSPQAYRAYREQRFLHKNNRR